MDRISLGEISIISEPFYFFQKHWIKTRYAVPQDEILHLVRSGLIYMNTSEKYISQKRKMQAFLHLGPGIDAFKGKMAD